MIVIPRRVIDIRPIVGAVVFFSIIGAVIFGAYFFAVAKPAAEALEASKLSALSQVNILSSIDTSQAISDALVYSAEIRDATSRSEVELIRAKVSIAIDREKKRRELLGKVDNAANGTFYSATGASGTIQMQVLLDLSQTLKAGIDAKREKWELEEYEAEIDRQATSTWITLHTQVIENISDDKIEMWKNSPASGGYVQKDWALSYVRGETWEALRKLRFKEASTVEAPVLDVFHRAPTIKPGSIVNIYVRDKAANVTSELWTNVKVRNVIFSEADITDIAWTLTDGAVTHSYLVDMWETIKAAAAGDLEAAAVGWREYGVDVMSRALSANIVSYPLSVLYVVEVPDAIGVRIFEYEMYLTETKDVFLLATI